MCCHVTLLHPICYRESKMEDDSNSNLAKKKMEKNTVAVVREHFGFRQQDVEQKTVIHEHCRKADSASQGNTTNLFQHLGHVRVTQYEQKRETKQQHPSTCDCLNFL